MENDYIKICPKCGSTNITSETGRYHIYGAQEYKDNCQDCGYSGIIPEVEKSKIEEFKKEIKNQNN